MAVRRRTGDRSVENWWSHLTAPDSAALPDSVSKRIEWYGQNVPYQRSMYRTAEIAVIVPSATIPAATELGAGADFAAVLGALVGVVGGLRHLFRWGENRIRSNKTLIDLRAEVTKWSQGLPPYENRPATSELVGRVEAIVAGETASWATTLQSAGE